MGGDLRSLLAVCAVLGVAVAQARVPEAPSYLSTTRVHLEASDPTSRPGETAGRDASKTGASSYVPEPDAVKDGGASAGAPERENRLRTRGKAGERTGRLPAHQPGRPRSRLSATRRCSVPSTRSGRRSPTSP